MKPIWLIISGFGPYREKIEIDFTLFKRQGLFLITGATGSGKTTLFDAISFALYGNTSGNIREKTTLRSDFSQEEIKTFVELKFEHKGIFYKIKRSPKYSRKKKRKEGVVFLNETAVLEEEEKTPITTVLEVNKRILSILGITYLQFKQIVMIAQGEFVNLLISNSKDRVDILRNLFQTEKYNILQSILTKKAADFNTRLVQLKMKREEAVSRIKPEDNTELLEILKQKEIYQEKLIFLLETLIEKEKKECKEYEKEIEIIQGQIKIFVAEISKQENKEKQKRELKEKQDKLLKQIEIEEKNFSKSLKETAKLEELEKQIKENQVQIESFERYLPLLKEYSELEQKQKKLLKLQEEKKKQIQELLKIQLEKRKEKLEAEKQKEKQEEYLRKLGEINLKIEKEKTKEHDLERLVQKQNVLQEEKEILKRQQKSYKKIESSYQEKKRKYEQAEIIYKSAVIGLAAKYLKEGQPCPVCGSLIHPKIAVISKKIPDEKEIDGLKEELQKEQKKYEESFQKAAVQKGTADSLEQEFFKEIEEKTILDTKDKNFNKKLEEMHRESKIELETYKKEARQLEKEVKTAKKLVEKLKEIETDLGLLEEKIQKEQKEKEKIEQEYHILLGKIEKIKTEVPKDLKDKAEAEKKLKNQKKEQSQRQKQKEQIEKEHKNIENQLKINFALYENLSKEIAVLEKEQLNYTNLEIQKQQLMCLEEKREKLLHLKEEKFIKEKTNTEVFEYIKKESKKIKKLEEEYKILKDLEQAIKGNNKKRAPLEYYVLSVYFEDILETANMRLLKITDGRYKLCKVEKVLDARTKDFLDLEVHDYYTGKKRSVKTLSGGEIFKAALSLALGLSEAVQNFAGGIQIDTLFLDEGFGTLDKESLEQALDVLMTLIEDNRLIGIISHVEELKERISQQIIVEKTAFGSYIKIQTENIYK